MVNAGSERSTLPCASMGEPAACGPGERSIVRRNVREPKVYIGDERAVHASSGE
jgi:hypothetical protein